MWGFRQGKNNMRILYVTTISLTINTFFKPHIDMLIKEGHEVDIACNCSNLDIDEFYINLGCKVHQIDFSRSPLTMDNLKAYRQLKSVVQKGEYDIVHCHTPNASAVTRLVCRKFRKKNGLRVFYTAHGFHFYKGAPKFNWMVYYPIEKLCSRFTDKLITINTEDYALAKNKFKAKEVHYVPGVGIELSKFSNVWVNRNEKRKEVGVPEDAFLLFSVGELNENKNHQVVIRALAMLNDPKVHYAIAGVGEKQEYLFALANELGVSEQVHLLGYRSDIPELNSVANLFCFPSFREGLSASLMEAMACGLPVVCSRIRGNTDLIEESGGRFFNANSVEEASGAICSVLKCDYGMMGNYNKSSVIKYSVENVLLEMKKIYTVGV